MENAAMASSISNTPTNVKEPQRPPRSRSCSLCPGAQTPPRSRRRCCTPPASMPSRSPLLESRSTFRPPTCRKHQRRLWRRSCVLLTGSNSQKRQKET
ncbi:hypothetical protein FOCC_FOCC000225 [Frankliniella occidentalis]|nr:hypothetical protein FOCC_FOCC000225 [Frankliniella occidentalis]